MPTREELQEAAWDRRSGDRRRDLFASRFKSGLRRLQEAPPSEERPPPREIYQNLIPEGPPGYDREGNLSSPVWNAPSPDSFGERFPDVASPPPPPTPIPTLPDYSQWDNLSSGYAQGGQVQNYQYGGMSTPSSVPGRNVTNTAGASVPTNWNSVGNEGLWGRPNTSVPGTYSELKQPGQGGSPYGRGYGAGGNLYGGPSALQGGIGTLGAPGMQNQFSSLPYVPEMDPNRGTTIQGNQSTWGREMVRMGGPESYYGSWSGVGSRAPQQPAPQQPAAPAASQANLGLPLQPANQPNYGAWGGAGGYAGGGQVTKGYQDGGEAAEQGQQGRSLSDKDLVFDYENNRLGGTPVVKFDWGPLTDAEREESNALMMLVPEDAPRSGSVVLGNGRQILYETVIVQGKRKARPIDRSMRSKALGIGERLGMYSGGLVGRMPLRY